MSDRIIWVIGLCLLNLTAQQFSMAQPTSTDTPCMESITQTRKVPEYYMATRSHKTTTKCGWWWRRCTKYKLMREKKMRYITITEILTVPCNQSAVSIQIPEDENVSVTPILDFPTDNGTFTAQQDDPGVTTPGEMAGTIIGLIAIIALVVAIVVVIFVRCKRRKNQKQSGNPNPPGSSQIEMATSGPDTINADMYYVGPETIRERKQRAIQKATNENYEETGDGASRACQVTQADQSEYSYDRLGETAKTMAQSDYQGNALNVYDHLQSHRESLDQNNALGSEDTTYYNYNAVGQISDKARERENMPYDNLSHTKADGTGQNPFNVPSSAYDHVESDHPAVRRRSNNEHVDTLC